MYWWNGRIHEVNPGADTVHMTYSIALSPLLW
jgi:hypothetical protein